MTVTTYNGIVEVNGRTYSPDEAEELVTLVRVAIDAARTHVPMASPKQIKFFNDLLRKKNLTYLTVEQQNWLKTADPATLTKADCRRVIQTLNTLPWLPKGSTRVVLPFGVTV